MIKVLVVSTVGLSYQGIASVIYNYSSRIDLEKYKLDFVAQPQIDESVKQRFMSIGNLVYATKKRDSVWKYAKDLYSITKNGNYDFVHIHGNSGTMVVETLICRICGVKRIAVHCHNTMTNHPVINQFFKAPMMKLASDLLACSNEAGTWLFEKKPFIVLNNAIDSDKFSYSHEVRSKIRSELQIKDDEFVIGHLGHFSEQKNHDFIIDVFARVRKTLPNAKLMLLGTGKLFDRIKEKTRDYGLSDSVLFIGTKDNPECYYQAMDLFIFPSKWEGLGLVLIEAQASGLSCIASSDVPRESNVSGTVDYLSLELDLWEKAILSDLNNKEDRDKISAENIERIKKSGYEISLQAKKLEKIYSGEVIFE